MRPLHQSSANAWALCQRLYALTVDRDRDPHFRPFVRGQAVHAGCEAAVAVGRGDSTREQQLAAGLQAIEDWSKIHAAAPDVMAEAMDIFAASLSDDSYLDFSRPYGCREDRVEIGWSLDENWNLLAWAEDAPGAAYSGRIDWLRVFEDRVEVVDFKSGMKVVGGDDLRDSDWQARLYSLAALAAVPGVREVRYTHFRLRAGLKVSATFRRGKAWARITRAYFSRVRSEIARTDLSDPEAVRATPGGGCSVCPIRIRCPERLAALESGAIEDDDTPTEVARKKMLFKPLGDYADRRLKQLASDEDVPYGGKLYGYRPRTSLVCPLTPRAFVERASRTWGADKLDELLPAGASPTKGRAIELARDELDADAIEDDYQGEITHAVIEQHALDTGLLVKTTKPRFGAYCPGGDETD